MRAIDGDELKEEIDYYIREAGWGETRNETLRWCLEFIDNKPTIEPERKKGKWIKGVGENGITTSEFCSCCRYENKHWCDWNFCPNCGADMREGQNGQTE